MKHAESMEEYWERQHRNAEQALAVARHNLARLAMKHQLQLFSTEGIVIPFPAKNILLTPLRLTDDAA